MALERSRSLSSVNLSSSADFYPVKRFPSVADLRTPMNYYEAKLSYQYRPHLSKYSRNYENPNNSLWYKYSGRYPQRYYPTRRLTWYVEPSYSSYFPRYGYHWIDTVCRRSYNNAYRWPHRYWSNISYYDYVYNDPYLHYKDYYYPY